MHAFRLKVLKFVQKQKLSRIWDLEFLWKEYSIFQGVDLKNLKKKIHFFQVFTPVRIYLLIAKVPTKVSIPVPKEWKLFSTSIVQRKYFYNKTKNKFPLYLQIDCHFHYLDIQSVESKKPTHFSIITNDRTYSFSTTGDAGNFSSVWKCCWIFHIFLFIVEQPLITISNKFYLFTCIVVEKRFFFFVQFSVFV